MSHPHPLPDRGPGELAAAGARLSAPGACCRHLFGAHRPDGSCSLAGVRACDCTGWQPLEPAGIDQGGYGDSYTGPLDAEVGSSGDPLTDAIHDVLARHYPATLDGRWVTCRDELIDAARAWAAGALGIQR